MFRLLLLVLVLVSSAPYSTARHEVVEESDFILVAQDGTGDYKTIQAALNQLKAFKGSRMTIKLAPGVYYEKIEVHAWTPQVSLIGSDPATTIIAFDDYSGKGGINTFTSFTAKISANDFYAENITFQNTAGPVGQAVVLHVEGDRCVFKNCRFVGDQDTIYTGGDSRQYFVDCYIEGTTDFIFGAATALFENCEIHSKKNSYITAASTTRGKRFGYVFMNCSLTAAERVTKVYLGRPWRSFAKTVFVDCVMGDHILPAGWHNWNKPEAERTVYYAEYQSRGALAHARVEWSYQLSEGERNYYSREEILKGCDDWKGELR